jgi:hypothetical protein
MIDCSVLYSSQGHLRTGMHDLDYPILAGAKNTDSCGVRTRALSQQDLLGGSCG